MTDAKQTIDTELAALTLSDAAKETIRSRAFPQRRRSVWKKWQVCLAACAVFLLVGAGVALTGTLKSVLNGQSLPELDGMTAVSFKPITDLTAIDDFYYERTYSGYGAAQEALGVDLLDSDWACREEILTRVSLLTTENQGAVHIFVRNYVLLDEADKDKMYPMDFDVFFYAEEESAQLGTEMHFDYGEGARFVGQYESPQGYKVNIIRSKSGSVDAYFVANGVTYDLSIAQRSFSSREDQAVVDKMLEIIGTMH